MESYWGLSGGMLGSARTDSGTGRGWTAVVGGGEQGGYSFSNFFGQIEVSHVTYDEDEKHREMTRVVFGGWGLSRWHRLGGGPALSFGEGDIWAIGPQVLYGVGFFGRRAEPYLMTSAYAWFGERDDEFDLDVEADIRFAAGVRF